MMTDDYTQDLIKRLYLAGRHPDNAIAMEAARAIELLSASKPSAMPGKDAVTREQIEAWAKLAGIPTMFEKHIEQLGDFAIFARMDYAASPAAPAQSNTCAHRIVDARNKFVESGYLCIDCGTVFAAVHTDAAPAQSGEPVQSEERALQEELWQLVDAARTWEKAYLDSGTLYGSLEPYKNEVEVQIRHIENRIKVRLAAPQPSQPVEDGDDWALPELMAAAGFTPDERSNSRIFNAVRAVLTDARAASPQATVTQPAQTERALSVEARAFYARHEARMGRVGPSQPAQTERAPHQSGDES
jgi:hypothetical protein